MSKPRYLEPGATYLVTRRCLQRQFLLRPSALVNQLFLFCVAIAAARFGILLHTVCVMSNHYHLVLSDPAARLPEFAAWLDAMLARALNRLHGRSECVWSPGSYNAVRLEDEDAIVGACGYALANPVSAGLVREARHWPGVRLAPDQRSLEVQRPGLFFREQGPLPKSATLNLTAPPGLAATVFAQRVHEATAAREEQARKQAVVRGRGFLGRRAVLAQSPRSYPKRGEPRPASRPLASAGDFATKQAAITRLREFWCAHRVARRRFEAGDREVLFPAGTYALRVQCGVRCAPW